MGVAIAVTESTLLKMTFNYGCLWQMNNPGELEKVNHIPFDPPSTSKVLVEV